MPGHGSTNQGLQQTINAAGTLVARQELAAAGSLHAGTDWQWQRNDSLLHASQA